VSATDIGPITVEITADQVRFRFADPRAMALEVPISLTEELTFFLNRRQSEIRDKRFVVDLEGLPALSSRQLGTMLTIRHACEPFGTVELEGVSGGVLYLLNLTRMAPYFGRIGQAAAKVPS